MVCSGRKQDGVAMVEFSGDETEDREWLKGVDTIF